jgi:prepilin-type N-terminal cleavage/methylation domain-containing protein
MADSSGFSLLEVLAALTILALALAALYNSFGTAIHARDIATQRLAATQLAQSLLSEQILNRVIEPAVSSGRVGAYQWVIAIKPFEDERPASPGQAKSRFEQKDQARAATPPPDQWKLFEISITVNWPRNRSVRFDTLHLARAQ